MGCLCEMESDAVYRLSKILSISILMENILACIAKLKFEIIVKVK